MKRGCVCSLDEKGEFTTLEDPAMAKGLLKLQIIMMAIGALTTSLPQPKIVFTPLAIGGSPYFNMLSLAEEMDRRGYSVSMLVTPTMQMKKSRVRHVEYNVSSDNALLTVLHKLSSDVKRGGPASLLSIGQSFLQVSHGTCTGILGNEQAKKEVLEADMLVILSVNICGGYLAHIFNKPFVVLHPGPLPVIGYFTDAPSPPSYVPMTGFEASDEMTVLQRVQNFIMFVAKNSLFDVVVSYYFQGLQTEHGLKREEWYSTIFGNAELYLITVDFSYEFVHPVAANVFMVGPLTPKPAAELPSDIEEYMQSSGEHGVVLISFGSFIGNLNDNIINIMLTAIGRFKQKFIWKVKLSADMRPPSNLKTLDWLPQNDLLGHPKTKAFISHMGINGASEAAYHGVPIIAASVMSDSFQNSIRFSKKAKMSKAINVFEADAETWERTIKEVLSNSSYKENALKASRRLQSRPKGSLENAGDLIKYAMDNGGRLPHLKSYAKNLYWFQYYCIDVIALLVALIVVSSVGFWRILRLLLSFASALLKKPKTE